MQPTLSKSLFTLPTRLSITFFSIFNPMFALVSSGAEIDLNLKHEMKSRNTSYEKETGL